MLKVDRTMPKLKSSSKSEKPDFYPPQLNPVLVRLYQAIAPTIGFWQYRMRLQVQPECLDKLNALRDQRLLLLPNHPTFHDWIAIFLLSAQIKEPFHYLAAYERFQGRQGKLLQQLGAYSIRRGLGDRPSVAKTLELLMQPNCRLVIFPEGGCSFQNDTVMPFRVGAIQIGLQALSKLAKQQAEVPDLYVLPISIKYRYIVDMAPVIHNMLSRLERSLRIKPSPDALFYQRLRAVAERVLVQFERDYGLQVDLSEAAHWNDRISRIKAHVLQSCEQKLGIAASNEPARERVYRIQAKLEAQAESIASADFWTYEAIHQATARLLNFDAIYDGYVAANPTAERFLDTLTRLERAVFAIEPPLPKGFRHVLIHIADPVNLKDYLASYQKARSLTVETLTAQLHQTVQTNLDRLNH
jgi:1-acyl-sn-glycerol-3-phosphate acyltransferase